MAAISTARHILLIKKIKALFTDGKPAEQEQKLLLEEAQQLQRIYDKYNGSLHELNSMIKEYDATQRKAKVRLRKQQLLLIKAKQTEISNF
jgi:predicted DNA binding CopG/RHH family protein